jgi:hypothetical protein
MIDSVTMKVYATEMRVAKITNLINSALAFRAFPKKKFVSLIGKIGFICKI